MTEEDMKHRIKSAVIFVLCWLCWVSGSTALATQAVDPKADDPHYSDAGFFDIHVCNWPNRPLFYKPLFSTTRFDDIKEIEVLYPDGRLLIKMDLTRYRLVEKPGKPLKKVFLGAENVPAKAPSDWYSARITMKDGKKYSARDFVSIETMPIAANLNPPANAENISLPRELTWSAVAGAKYYQVFIKDLWDDERVIHTSGFLDQPRLQLPSGLIQPGGWYSWRVHARDVNEDKRLGDFNHGSLGAEQKFSVAQ